MVRALCPRPALRLLCVLLHICRATSLATAAHDGASTESWPLLLLWCLLCAPAQHKVELSDTSDLLHRCCSAVRFASRVG